MKIKALLCSVLVLAVIAVFASCASEKFDNVENIGQTLDIAADAGAENVNDIKTADTNNSDDQSADIFPDADYTKDQAIADGCRVIVVNKVVNDYGFTVSDYEYLSEGNRIEFRDAIKAGEFAETAYAYFNDDGTVNQYVKYAADEDGYHYKTAVYTDGNTEIKSYDYAYFDYAEYGKTFMFLFTNDETMDFEAYNKQAFTGAYPDDRIKQETAMLFTESL